MPTYEYACRACGHGFEVVQSMRDDALTECPNCGGELRKVFAPPAISFKGSGFYATDHGKKGSSSSEKSGEGSGEGSGGEKKSGEGSGTKVGSGEGSSSGGEGTGTPTKDGGSGGSPGNSSDGSSRGTPSGGGAAKNAKKETSS